MVVNDKIRLVPAYFHAFTIFLLLFSIFLGYAVHLRVFSECCKAQKNFPVYLLKKIHVQVDLCSSTPCCSRDNCGLSSISILPTTL